MLSQGVRARRLPRVAANVMDLPFAEASFDLVTASFVVGWLPDHERGLSEMVRVVRTGGSIAISWHAETDDETEDDPWTVWWDRLLTVAAEEILDDLWTRAVPSAGRFSDPGRMRTTLHDAGLDVVGIEKRRYRLTWSVDEFVDAAANAPDARFVRKELGQTDWDMFRTAAEEALRSRFGETLYEPEVAILAVAAKR